MIDIFFALVSFVLAVTLHMFFCRATFVQGLHARVFIFMAIGCFGVYWLLVSVWPHSGESFKVTGSIIFGLLIPVYLCFYVLTQLTSPSQKILSAIATQGPMTWEQLVDIIEKEDFIMTRLEDLCVSGCVQKINGRYVLSAEGKKIALSLQAMQNILGRQAGG